eukprot:6407584-Pyramimonas_sp.AAC.1
MADTFSSWIARKPMGAKSMYSTVNESKSKSEMYSSIDARSANTTYRMIKFALRATQRIKCDRTYQT